MEYSAQAIAALVNGKIIGDPQVTVKDFSKIEEATEGSLTFLANPKYLKYLKNTEASIVLISKDLVPSYQVKPTLIVVDDAYKALAVLLEFYKKMTHTRKGREKNSYVHSSAKIGKDVYIGAFVYISENCVIGDRVQIYPHVYIGENVRIGEGTVLYPGVKIYNDTVIGKNCIIHAGTVIGSDGFGFAPQEDGTYKKIAQIGNVIIEDDVEIGANCAIDRATMGSTIIRRGVKIDNLVQVAHNVEIGENTVIAAQTGFAGSTKIGKNNMIGGQAGFAGHIKIGNNVKIGAKSGVIKDIEDNQTILGQPAMPFREYSRNLAVFKRLHQFYSEFLDLKKTINKLLKNKI